MNLLKRFNRLLPRSQKFYGEIVSITSSEKIVIETVTGNNLIIYSTKYASEFQEGAKVWCILDSSGIWTLESAPTFSSTETIEV